MTIERVKRPCYTGPESKCAFYISTELGAFCQLLEYPQTEHDMDELIRPDLCQYRYNKEEIKAIIDRCNGD